MLKQLMAAFAAFLLSAMPVVADIGGTGPAPAQNAVVLPVITQINGPITVAGPITTQHGGWSATYRGTPPLNISSNPIPLIASRPGFDTSGNATTYNDTIYIQTNLRVAGPPYVGPPMTADTTNVGLSKTLYAEDSISGVTNLSDEHSPQPDCNWQMPGRRLITRFVTVSIVCAHIDGRNNNQIANATFTMTDVGAAHSASCSANFLADDNLFSNDRIHSDFYSCVIDGLNLNSGVLLTLNAVVKPFLGTVAAGSVWDTSTVTSAQSPSGSVERQFSPRYFIKDAVRSGAGVALVCPAGGTYPNGNCSAAGTDATGKWANGSIDTTHTFATPKGAFDAITDATRGKPFTAMSGCVNGCADGLTLYINQAIDVAMAAPTSNVPQLVGALLVSSDPGGAGKATMSYSSAFSPKMAIGTSLIPTSAEGTIWVDNLNWTRTANVIITGGASNNIEFQFTNSVIDLGATFSAALCSNCALRLYANTINNYDGGISETGTEEVRNMRGNLFASISTATAVLSRWNMVGNEIDGTSGHVVTLNSARADSGTIVYNNIIHFPSSSSDTLSTATTTAEITGFAVLQNIIEINNNASNVSMGLSRDCDTGAVGGILKHAIIQYNVITGLGSNGRPNVFYDTCSNPPGLSTPAVYHRPHHLIDYRGNAMGVIVYMKEDWFSYNTNGDHTNGQTMIGGWPFMFGTGLQGNLQRFCDVADSCYGGDRNFFYTGRGSINGTADHTDTVANPLWTNDQGIQIGGASGAGYGDYHIGGLSPCKGVVENPTLAHGIYGDVRPATGDSCGVNP